MNDFPDILPPMMVKELRQGLRSRAFYFAFAITLIGLFGAILPGEENQSTSEFAFFWALGIALIVVFPLRGLAAFSSEESPTTLDLVRTSNLGTWKIVMGKWAAIIAQSVLFTSTALPFIIVRYFSGGTSIILDLIWIAVFLAGNFFFTTAAILVSTSRTAPIRMVGSLIVVLTGFALLSGFLFEIYDAYLNNNIDAPFWLPFALLFIVTGGLTLCFCLTICTVLSSPSENFATPTRFVVLLLLVILFGIAFIPNVNPDVTLYIASITLTAFAFCTSLAERANSTQSSLSRFATSPIKRIARYIFEPGWHSGILFLIPTTALCAATLTAAIERPNYIDLPIHFLAIFLTHLVIFGVPAAISFSAARLLGGRAPAFLVILALSFVITIAFEVVTQSLNIEPMSSPPVLALGCIMPPVIYSLLPGLGMISSTYEQTTEVSYLVILVSGIHLTILTSFFRHALREPFQQTGALITPTSSAT